MRIDCADRSDIHSICVYRSTQKKKQQQKTAEILLPVEACFATAFMSLVYEMLLIHFALYWRCCYDFFFSLFYWQ